MRCENKFCIYQKLYECKANPIFEPVELDRNGCCKTFIPINMDDLELIELKERDQNDLLYIASESVKNLKRG